MRRASGDRSLSFFSVKSALTHHCPEGAAVVCLWQRALSEADAAPAGALWTMPHHGGAAVIVHAVIAITSAFAYASRGTTCTPPCANCPHKPATGSFICGYGYRFFCDTHFLFAKKKQKQGREDGENEWRSTTWKQRS